MFTWNSFTGVCFHPKQTISVILIVLLGYVQLFAPIHIARAEELSLPNMKTTLNLTLHNIPLDEALKAVATQAQFNIVLGDDLTREVNLDFKGVTVKDVLMALKQMGKLYYHIEKGTLFVTTRQSNTSNGIKQQEHHVIQVKHLPASFVADYLNATLFSYAQNSVSSPSPTTGTGNATGSSSTQTNSPTQAIAIAEPITNRVILRTDAQDAQDAVRLVNELDVKRESKTWRLNFQRADEVASALAATVFSNGSTPAITLNANSNGSSGTGSNNTTGGNTNGSPNGTSNGTANAGSSNANTGASTSTIGTANTNPIPLTTEGLKDGEGTANNHTLRSRPIQNTQATVSSNGPIILPDTRINTLTLFATPQQLAMADEFIQEFDRQRQQVYVEMAVIELSDSLEKLLTPSLQARLKQSTLGFNTTGSGQSLASYIKNPIQNTSNFSAILNFLHTESKLKVISRPSLLLLNNEEATLKIEDEVIQGFTDVRDQNNNVIARVAQQASAGIVLNLRSIVGANGDISMRVLPQFSFPQTSSTSDIQLISSRSWYTENVILKEGQSFVIGGLTQRSELQRNNKIPLLGDLPVLKGFSNTYDGSQKNKELLIMLTPRLVEHNPSLYSRSSHSNLVEPTPVFQKSPVTPKNF